MLQDDVFKAFYIYKQSNVIDKLGLFSSMASGLDIGGGRGDIVNTD